jgi:hypothetical protein
MKMPIGSTTMPYPEMICSTNLRCTGTEETTMTENCRFVLDGGRYVIDLLNPANSGKGYCHEGEPENDIYLRERVLMVLLGERLQKLIYDGQPKLKHWRTGKEYQPYNHDRHAVWWAILSAILASHLNTFDPKLSVQHKFDGTLKRKKVGVQSYTSIALFVDDVERLLRDLYGDLEGEAITGIRNAVFAITEQFVRYVQSDLWDEHHCASNHDDMFGIGVPEGYSLGSSAWAAGMRAADELRERVRTVRSNPQSFGEYTHEFVRFWEG